MTAIRLRVGLLLASLILLSIFCLRAIALQSSAQTAYRNVQEQTNREQLIKEQVTIEDLTRRVDYQESVHADIRIGQMEQTMGHIMTILIGLCIGVGGTLLESLIRLTRKKQTT